MYAVIKAGGKQYKVQEGENLRIEKIEGEVGSKITLSEVLLIGGDEKPRIGAPVVEGATVDCDVIRQAKAKKVTVFKKKRRKGYQKKYGHRQPYTELKITKINA